MNNRQEAQAQTLGRLRAVIKQTLKNYRMRNVQIDDSDEGLPLVDMLTPKGAGSIACGLEEIDQITDDLIDSVIEIVDHQAQKIAEQAKEIERLNPKKYTYDELYALFEKHWDSHEQLTHSASIGFMMCAKLLAAMK